jgi:hypothetical protein
MARATMFVTADAMAVTGWKRVNLEAMAISISNWGAKNVMVMTMLVHNGSRYRTKKYSRHWSRIRLQQSLLRPRSTEQ